jgi:hypothetical protein
MKYTLLFGLIVTSLSSALGQSSEPVPPAASSGVDSEWDIRKLLDALSQQAAHLKPIIDQVQPADWQSKGASETYVAQWNTVQAQLKYLIASTDAFARQPERLPLGLDAYFRMQAMESTLGSLIEGVRNYQNPALAFLIQAIVSENSANRGRLRQYLQDLATQKEQEFQVADREAQRCRATLLQQPAPQTKKAIHP